MDNVDRLISSINHYKNGSFHLADQIAQDILRDDPNDKTAWLIRGRCASESKNLSDAIVCFEKCLEIDSKFLDALRSYLAALFASGRYMPAIEVAQRILDDTPNDLSTLLIQADTLLQLSKFDLAEKVLNYALKHHPDHSGVLVLLGRCVSGNFKNVEAALGYCVRALKANPRSVPANNDLGLYLLKAGDAISACKCFLTAFELCESDNEKFCSNYIYSLNYRDDLEGKDVYEKTLAVVSDHFKVYNKDIGKSNRERLRVGFLSPDFRRHSVAYFLMHLFTYYPKDLFSFICFSDLNESQEDEVSQALKANVDEWYSVKNFQTDYLHEFIDENKIDILIDLTGHTGSNRMPLFSRRVCPVQISWLGYPATTGVKNIDYRIVDHITDPNPEADSICSEKLCRVKPHFLCYDPLLGPGESHIVSPIQNTEQKIVFGSFNEAAKYNESTIRLWSELLLKVPNSVLTLKSFSLGEKKTQDFFYDMFHKFNISPNRLNFLGRSPSRHEHLQIYNQIDVALDPFPYNGTTTSCEALYMGVPFITKLGNWHSARVGATILNSLNMNDWIAENDDEYINKAIKVSKDLPSLRKLKNGLRKRFLQSDLCNGKKFARAFTDCLNEIWRA